MPNTFELIASSTVGSGGASSVAFNSIPQTYTDLVIRASARGSNGSVNSPFLIQFNALTSGYTGRSLYGSGSGAASDNNPYSANNRLFGGEGTGDTATANTFGVTDIYIPNYTGSTNKSTSSDSATENNATTAYAVLAAALSSNTAAITDITITTYSGTTWKQYSTFYLYGVKNA